MKKLFPFLAILLLFAAFSPTYAVPAPDNPTEQTVLFQSDNPQMDIAIETSQTYNFMLNDFSYCQEQTGQANSGNEYAEKQEGFSPPGNIGKNYCNKNKYSLATGKNVSTKPAIWRC